MNLGTLSTLGRSAKLELSRRDFRAFFEEYFGHYISRETTDFHEFLFGVGRAIEGSGQLYNVIGAKETAKSTIITLAATIHAVVFERKRYATIMSNKNAIKDHSIAIVRELTSNAKLLSDFGRKIEPKRDIKNQTEEFHDSAVILRNDAKIRFLTPGQSLRGTRHLTWRPDLFIGDDVHKRSDFDSPARLEQQVKDVMAEAIGCLDARLGSACILGNRSDRDGLQGQLERNPSWRSSRWPIVRPDGSFRGMTQAEGEALRRRVGEYVWLTDFECREFDGRRRVYDFERFSQFEASSVIWRWLPEGRWLRMVGADPIERCMVVLDPSRGFDRQRPRAERSGDPDRAALIVGGQGRSGRVYVVHAELMHDDPGDEVPFTTRQIETLARTCVGWGADELVIENNGFQELLRTDVEKAFESAGVPIRPTGETSSTRKETRIVSMEPAINQGEILFSDGLPEEYKREWAAFTVAGTRGHDDGMDGTEVLFRNIRASVGSAWSFGPSRRAA